MKEIASKDEAGTPARIIDDNTIDMCNCDGTSIAINDKLVVGDDDSTPASYNYNANSVTRLAKLELDSLQNIDEINKYIERLALNTISDPDFYKNYIVDNGSEYELVNIPDTDILDNLPIIPTVITHIKEHFGADFKGVSQDEIINELKQEFALSDEMMELSNELNNEASDYFNKLLRDKKDKEKAKCLKAVDITELQELDDSIGEESRMLDEIDYDNRNAAFMDLDGDILISKPEETHAQLINRYLKEHSEGKELDDDFCRPTSNEVEETCNVDRIAFGHIIGYIWIIDTYSISNMSVDEVISDIKDSGKTFSKIYSLNQSGGKVKRLARRNK
jgi:hypothetical protein